MPRFENEDFDPKKRNREDIDRTVPKDEDYYNYSPEDIDLNFCLLYTSDAADD